MLADKIVAVLLFIMGFIVLLAIFTLPVKADDSCISSSWTNITKIDDTIGYVSTYMTDSTNLKIDNLLCILGSEFFRNINNFPDEATVGIINKTLKTGYVAKWSISKNTLVLIRLDGNNVGLANIYPKPLDRLEELFTNKKFPSPASKSPILRDSVRSKKIVMDEKIFNILTDK